MGCTSDVMRTTIVGVARADVGISCSGGRMSTVALGKGDAAAMLVGVAVRSGCGAFTLNSWLTAMAARITARAMKISPSLRCHFMDHDSSE